MTKAVIVDVVRIASGKGKPGGALSGTHPVELMAHVLRSITSRNGLDPALVDDVIGGCVGQAGEQALNITRSAVLSAGFPESVPATTIDRQCGSSQQAAHFAAQGVIAGAYDIVIAAGRRIHESCPDGHYDDGEGCFRSGRRGSLPRRPGQPGHLRGVDHREVEVRPRRSRRICCAVPPAGRGGGGEGALRQGDSADLGDQRRR